MQVVDAISFCHLYVASPAILVTCYRLGKRVSGAWRRMIGLIGPHSARTR
jgi:hypothetical protein